MASAGEYTLKFERLELQQEWKEEQMKLEMKEMRKLIGELGKKLSSQDEAQFVPMKKIKQALAKLTDNAAVLIQGEPPSK